MKPYLIASAGNCTELEALINKYFCSNSCSIVKAEDGTMKIYNAFQNRTLDNFRVIVKRGRWRFEGI